ncbi:hypothetical protein KC216_22235, partial [Mycobacterium tuberculosis]|uniref:hypothetical protein n=1 Tax=Mycobacterium tuberculosis TaxID=1773 RepID=UPI001B81BB63
LGLAAGAALAIRIADGSGVAVARLWGDLVYPSSFGAPTLLGPAIAVLADAAFLVAFYAMALKVRGLDDLRETPVALGI